MTYPPQPGQGGWGQPGQPGPYGPQTGPQSGHPGGYPQPGGQYPQTGPQPGGQYPQTGPQPGGQYPPSGQQYAQYPPSGPQPQAGWGQQPGAYGQPPKKKNTGLIIGIAAGAVVLLVVAVVAFFTMFTGQSAQSVAQSMVDRLNAKDYAGANELVCSKERESSEKLSNMNIEENLPAELKGTTLSWSLNGEVVEKGDKATGKIAVEMKNLPAQYEEMIPDNMRKQSFPMTLTKEGGAWKVCGMATG